MGEKPEEAETPEETEEVTFEFEPGELGFDADFETGTGIRSISLDGQAYKLGVVRGMVIFKIDGVDYSAELLNTKKNGNMAYRITFKICNFHLPMSRRCAIDLRKGRFVNGHEFEDPAFMNVGGQYCSELEEGSVIRTIDEAMSLCINGKDSTGEFSIGGQTYKAPCNGVVFTEDTDRNMEEGSTFKTCWKLSGPQKGYKVLLKPSKQAPGTDI